MEGIYKVSRIVLWASLVLAAAPAAILYWYSSPSKPSSFLSHGKEADGVEIKFATPVPKEMAPGVEFGVQSVKIQDGFLFRILLENHTWIDARLKTATKDEATEQVVQVIKGSTSPSVTLLRRVNGFWIVEFGLTVSGKRTTLSGWLTEQKLVL
jgi:hypothetical protein